jgi:hypothetical protein
MSEPKTMVTFEDLVEFPDPATLPPLDRPGVDEASLTADQAAWRRDGVVIKRGFIPDALLDPYIERRAAYRAGAKGHLAGWQYGHCYVGLPSLRDVALYPPLMDLLGALIGEEMLFHLALTAWVTTGREWHQDDYLNPDFVNTWYAAAWIALDDIAPDSGPFEYVPGSHRWGLMRGARVRAHLTEEELTRVEPAHGMNQWPKYAERFVTPAIEAKIAGCGIPVVPFLGRKGDVLIWHSRLIHRGSPGQPGRLRKSLITHYSGIDHRPDMVIKARDANDRAYAVFDEPDLN